MDCSLPGYSVHGILQARIWEWAAISSPGDFPNPGIKPASPAHRQIFTTVYYRYFGLADMSRFLKEGGSEVKSSNAGDPGLIPGSGRSPREGNGNPLQYSCLENPMERGA